MDRYPWPSPQDPDGKPPDGHLEFVIPVAGSRPEIQGRMRLSPRSGFSGRRVKALTLLPKVLLW